MGGEGGEENGGSVRIRSRSPTRFRAFPPRSPFLSSLPLLCSARLLATPRLVATTPSLFFAPFLYPRLIDAGLENQDGRPITLSISRSPVYLRGNILPKNKYLRRARPLAFRFFIHHPPLHPLGGGWRPFPGSSYPSSSRKDLLPEGESNLFALEMMTIFGSSITLLSLFLSFLLLPQTSFVPRDSTRASFSTSSLSRFAGRGRGKGRGREIRLFSANQSTKRISGRKVLQSHGAALKIPFYKICYGIA